MRRIRVVSLATFITVLAGCSKSNVVLPPQSNNLLVSPSSIVLSVSQQPSVAAFAVADKLANGGSLSMNQDTCSGIASLQQSASVMTVGSNPGVQVGGPSGGVSGGSSGGSYGVSALAPGRCTIRVADALGNVATVFVVVKP